MRACVCVHACVHVCVRMHVGVCPYAYLCASLRISMISNAFSNYSSLFCCDALVLRPLKKIISASFVCVCVCMCMYLCVCACVCVCVGGGGGVHVCVVHGMCVCVRACMRACVSFVFLFHSTRWKPVLHS